MRPPTVPHHIADIFDRPDTLTSICARRRPRKCAELAHTETLPVTYVDGRRMGCQPRGRVQRGQQVRREVCTSFVTAFPRAAAVRKPANASFTPNRFVAYSQCSRNFTAICTGTFKSFPPVSGIPSRAAVHTMLRTMMVLCWFLVCMVCVVLKITCVLSLCASFSSRRSAIFFTLYLFLFPTSVRYFSS
ncbi:hypothetical protein B0H13DRAFT_2278039 [Mycena leptocephala]|nr:hypothetical protein B0H13DRAFT_2278039 [Mycena leptocephala]